MVGDIIADSRATSPGFRICRSIERASLEKKPSIRLSQDAWVGEKVKVKRPGGRAASQAVVSCETCAERLSRMISIAVSAGYAVSKSSIGPARPIARGSYVRVDRRCRAELRVQCGALSRPA